MAAYGDQGPMGAYEYDHLVPLELGGAVNDPRNLWPEPGASPNPKDAVENGLRRQVCDGELTLIRAQRAIAADWGALASVAPGRAPAATTPEQTAPVPAPSRAGAECAASASYNSRYDDYDVYVRSNEPDQRVTVSDTAGRTASWHTDASGSADVYFRAGADAAGETVTVSVGGASCQTTL
jgi:hypothetical protein